ncbi:MAG: hypothetical protein ACXWQR_05370 [Ktedonobacterales bacterium]
MDPEDFISPEVGITAAVIATIASPPVRKVVRRGAVLGVAGALMAGDAITSFARGFGQGVGEGARRVAQGASAVGSQVAEQMQGGRDGQGASGSTGDGEQSAHDGEAKNLGEPS